MPAFHLPTVNNSPAHIEGEAEQLRAFLAAPNDPLITARIGQEQEVRREGSLLVLQGERYNTREGWTQGLRYLRLEEGVAVAALNLTRIKQGRTTQTLASNVYVDPDYRRQGLASALLAEAQNDYPKLRADSSMSLAGAALTGHGAPAPVRRPAGP